MITQIILVVGIVILLWKVGGASLVRRRRPRRALSFWSVVTRVRDGDTIEVATNNGPIAIRLFGIDAPEHNQDYGDAARGALWGLAGRAEVFVQGYEYDVYGRLVADCFVDGISLSESMLSEGHAWVLDDDGLPPGFYEAECVARNGGRGLWADACPVPPWEFRRHQT